MSKPSWCWVTVLALLLPGLCLAASPRRIYRSASPAVVLIVASDGKGEPGSAGTGSIVTADGRVITNAHVVLNKLGEPYKALWVFLKPEKVTGEPRRDLTRRFAARVVAHSPPGALDLALLELERAPSDLSTISFAPPGEAEVGDSVVAIGHPEQGGLWSLTTGSLSAVIANYGGIHGKDVFQTEASINRGNSGGPLLDESGRMVGVNTMIARRGADGVAITDVNFSLRGGVVLAWLAREGVFLSASRGSSGRHDSRRLPRVARAKEAAPVVIRGDVDVAALRESHAELGRAGARESRKSGEVETQRFARAKVVTPRRPFDLDVLRKRVMDEMDVMMREMRDLVEAHRRGGR